MLRKLFVATLTVGALVLALGQNQANAQVKPFHVTGGGRVDYIPFPGDPAAYHFADGTATHLGNYHADGWVQVDQFTSPTTADFSSAQPVVFTGANGDELHFDYQGSVELIPLGDGTFVTVWIAEFTPVAGSTGRFTKVVGGSFTMTAVTEPFAFGDTDVAYTWEGSGTLEFSEGQ